MGNARIPAASYLDDPITIDDGTLARTGSPPPGPIGLAAESGGPIMMPRWNWRDEGFWGPPVPRASIGERVFRAWGGRSSMRGSPTRPGVCFSMRAPQSRLDAEKLFAVFEWGNSCENLTEFLVPPSTVLWIGQVDPGDARAVFGLFSGPQTFIENPAAQQVMPIRTIRLSNDLGRSRVHQSESKTAR